MKNVSIRGLDWREAVYVLTSVMSEEDFEFTVEAGGHKWDVYRFIADGKRGQIAFRLTDEGEAVISYWSAGWKPAEEVQAKIAAGSSS